MLFSCTDEHSQKQGWAFMHDLEMIMELATSLLEDLDWEGKFEVVICLQPHPTLSQDLASQLSRLRAWSGA